MSDISTKLNKQKTSISQIQGLKLFTNRYFESTKEPTKSIKNKVIKEKKGKRKEKKATKRNNK